jgi:hypothetical protein
MFCCCSKKLCKEILAKLEELNQAAIMQAKMQERMAKALESIAAHDPNRIVGVTVQPTKP